MKTFDLTPELRSKLFEHTIDRLEAYYANTKKYPVFSKLDYHEIVNVVQDVDFDHVLQPVEAVEKVIDGLERYTLHSPHPKCFGLFVPRSAFPGVIADLITAVINPQLASWFHAAYAIEVENFLIREFAIKFGYPRESIDGIFTSGGNEANLTAVLTALSHRYPEFDHTGVFGLTSRPLIYCSAEAHHSIVKAAKASGLGANSVRRVPAQKDLRMDLKQLKLMIEQDQSKGLQAFMIVGTAGTTGAGVIDDLKSVGKIASETGCWFHIDAAYGGAAILSSRTNSLLAGIELSNSITFDAHKWISMPMGISLFITSQAGILAKTFNVNPTYVPEKDEKIKKVEPYTDSIQWSRRFMGLKLYLNLLICGWKGFEEMIDHQVHIGGQLRKRLIENDWMITNHTQLPVVCFTDPNLDSDQKFTKTIVQNINASGRSWISNYPIEGKPSIRTCISNYQSGEKEIDELVLELDRERANYLKSNSTSLLN